MSAVESLDNLLLQNAAAKVSATMRNKSVIVICSILMSGCGLAQQARFRNDEADATTQQSIALAECNRLFPDKNQKPVKARIECLNNADLNYQYAMARSIGRSEIDIVSVMAAKRLVAAERYDNGLTTSAQYSAEVAEIGSAATSQILARKNNAMVAQAAVNQANAAEQQAAAARQQAITASIPRQITCNTYGTMTTCN